MTKPQVLYQYQSIAKMLKERILRGDYGGGGRLPSERILGDEFQVQRNTVRQALSLLEREGLIATEKKRGSFLTAPVPTTGSRSFLVNIHGDDAPNLNQLRDGFSRTARDAGFSVRMFDSHPALGAALDPIPSASDLSEDVAGLLVWPQNPTNAQQLASLAVKAPMVLVDRRVMGLSVDCVRFADSAGGRMVAEHLISVGHQRICFISDEVFAETVQNRWRGYVLALEEHGISVDPRLSLFFHGIDAPYFAQSLRYLLGLGSDAPTAIMCSNDLVAFNLLRFLHDEGIRVPEDLAVTGYGNLQPDYVNAMGLTSVHQPFYELGVAAAKILIDRAGEPHGRGWEKTPLDIEIPVQLVPRRSSGKSG